MLDDILPLLRCPHCEGALSRDGEQVSCASGHDFDLARQGYLSLLGGDAGAGTGDSAAMVSAREAFLAGGHFEPLAERIAAECAEAAGEAKGCLVEAGAGAGHYLARVLEEMPGRAGVALDLSKPALRRAARAHPRAGAVACDVWGPLPLREGVAAAVLDVFAPRNPAEFARILSPRGVAVLAIPMQHHLSELTGPLELLSVDEEKPARLRRQLAAFEALSEHACEFEMSLDHTDIGNLVAMGPSARHAGPGLAEKIEDLPEPLTVTASVRISVRRLPA